MKGMDFYGAVVPRAWFVVLLSFLAAYYSAHYLGQAEFSTRLFSHACSGGTWLSAAHSFAMSVSGLIALGLTLGYGWLGDFSGVTLRQDHKGGSVKAAAFLLVMFSIGMSLFLLPCESQSAGEGLTSAGRIGYVLVGLSKSNILIFSVMHSGLLACSFFAGATLLRLIIIK